MFELTIKRNLTREQRMDFAIGWVKSTGKDLDYGDEDFIEWLTTAHKMTETQAWFIMSEWCNYRFDDTKRSADRFRRRLEVRAAKEKKLEETLEELKKIKKEK